MRNTLGITMAMVALACGGAAAAGMSKEEYKAAAKRVAAEYEAERQKCGVRHGNDADICIAHAHGDRDVAKAELEAAYKPGSGTNYDAAIARAKAAYAVARQECDNQQGKARTGCVADAKAARERAKVDAAAARKASRAEEAAAARPPGPAR